MRPLIDYQAIVLDVDAQTVRFTKSGTTIDLGGIAKGFAVEIAAKSLSRRGLTGMLDAGGNQYLVGLPPGKRAWTIGIRNPDVPDALLGVVEIPGGAISTSSDSSNFLVAPGRGTGTCSIRERFSRPKPLRA